MKQVLALFGEVFGEPDAYLRNPPTDGYLRTLLAKPHSSRWSRATASR